MRSLFAVPLHAHFFAQIVHRIFAYCSKWVHFARCRSMWFWTRCVCVARHQMLPCVQLQHFQPLTAVCCPLALYLQPVEFDKVPLRLPSAPNIVMCSVFFKSFQFYSHILKKRKKKKPLKLSCKSKSYLLPRCQVAPHPVFCVLFT